MNKFILISLFILATNCKKSKRQENAHLLSYEQMKAILVDFFSYQSIEKLNKEEVNTFVLNKHKISKKDFEETHNYYLIHSKEYFKLLDEAKEELDKKTKKIEEEIKEEEKAIADKKKFFEAELEVISKNKEKADLVQLKSPKKLGEEKKKTFEVIQEAKKAIKNLKDLNTNSLESIQNLIKQAKSKAEAYDKKIEAEKKKEVEKSKKRIKKTKNRNI